MKSKARIGKIIKESRLNNNLRMDDVAKEIGMSKSAVRKYCQDVGLSGVMEKHDLLLPETRANVDDTKGSGVTCKVTYVFADEPNEKVLPEVIRILSNVSKRQEALP